MRSCCRREKDRRCGVSFRRRQLRAPGGVVERERRQRGQCDRAAECGYTHRCECPIPCCDEGLVFEPAGTGEKSSVRGKICGSSGRKCSIRGEARLPDGTFVANKSADPEDDQLRSWCIRWSRAYQSPVMPSRSIGLLSVRC